MIKECNNMQGQPLDKNMSMAYKGIAILIIMLCHAMGIFGQGRITVFTPLGGIGVSIFLFLSAYGLNESWEEKKRDSTAEKFWWRKRFITVWIPYIVIQLIAFWPFSEFEPTTFCLDLTMVNPLYHYGWYLQYLFMWYFSFYIVRRIHFLDKYHIIIFTIISIACFFLLREIKAEQSLSFMAGILMSEKKDLQIKVFKIKYGVVFMAVGIFYLAVKQLSIVRSSPQLIMNFVQLGIKLPIGLGVMILFWLITKKIKVFCILMGMVGAISYELYLIHGYVLKEMPLSITGIIMFVVITGIMSFLYGWALRKLKPMLYRIFRIRSFT